MYVNCRSCIEWFEWAVNRKANVEDAAYLNLYPVTFQARDARWLAISLSANPISSMETGQESVILVAEVYLAKSSINWLGNMWGCAAGHSAGWSGLLLVCFHFHLAKLVVLQDRHTERRSPFWPNLSALECIPYWPDTLCWLHWLHLNMGLVLMLDGRTGSSRAEFQLSKPNRLMCSTHTNLHEKNVYIYVDYLEYLDFSFTHPTAFFGQRAPYRWPFRMAITPFLYVINYYLLFTIYYYLLFIIYNLL